MVGLLELGRGQVVGRRVETLAIPPCHPRRRRELELIGGPPGALGPDELGLVEAVDRFGEGIIEAVALGADRGDRTLVGEPFGVADGQVLGTPVAGRVPVNVATRTVVRGV